jgi:alkaline phosphatase D
MAPVTAPDLSQTPPQLAAALEQVRPGVSQLLKLTRFPFPLDPDAWDGYPDARARVLSAIRGSGGNAIVVSGDSHAAWANELGDEHGRVAVEFGGTSVTSPSEAEYFARAGLDFDAGIRSRNPQVKWTDHDKRGFLMLTLTRDSAKAEFFTVSTILARAFETSLDAAFTIAPHGGPGIGAITPAT